MNSSSPTMERLPPLKRTKKGASGLASRDCGQTSQALTEDENVTLSSLSSKIDEILARLDAKDSKIESLENENVQLKRRICTLEERVESIEASSRCNNLVLSGGEVSKLPSADNLKQPIIDLLKHHLNYVLPEKSLFAAFRLGAKPQPHSRDNRNILLKLVNTDIKRDIISSCRTVKPEGLFANDDLTQLKSSILYALRQCKKKFPSKVAGCGSRDSRVFMYLKPPNPSARDQRVFIDSMHKLDELCTREFNISSQELLGNGTSN